MISLKRFCRNSLDHILSSIAKRGDRAIWQRPADTCWHTNASVPHFHRMSLRALRRFSPNVA